MADGYQVVPIMSPISYTTDTRFGKAKDFIEEIESTCGRKIIHSIVEAEPIGPKKMVDVMIVCPCTGNTLAKLANSITDTAVTMAVKSHLRNSGPVVLALATNDALSGSAKNIGKLMNYKNIYFVPMKQDDPEKKPTSVILIMCFRRRLPLWKENNCSPHFYKRVTITVLYSNHLRSGSYDIAALHKNKTICL